MFLRRQSAYHVTRTGRRAIAATELAMLAPFVGMLIVGMCEMGRAVMVKDILTNAARKSCRTGAMISKSYQDIQNEVSDILSSNNISASSATVTVQVATYTGTGTTPSWGALTTVTSGTFAPNPLDQISVKVGIPISNVLWFSPQFMSKTAIESETLIMVRQ
jgi:Flp pilus assembly protein TadG